MKYMIFDMCEKEFVRMFETLEDAQAYAQEVDDGDFVIYRIDKTYTPTVTRVYSWAHTDE